MKAEIQQLKNELYKYQVGWPPGHFYSPIPSLEQIKKREDKIWSDAPLCIQGIDLREEEQLKLLHTLASYYAFQPWKDHKQKYLRYYFDNPNFSYGESILLFCMLMHLKPKKVIEIGSGYSSCVLLDTNELFFHNSISYTFIEPYPELLLSLLKPSDAENIQILPSGLQDVEAGTFSALKSGDVLLIDSTHVSKVDSDVNHILFSVLPQLKSGVYIHFHDICYPFEYPKEWIYQGRAWNEAYILRAFLQYNNQFDIVLFNSFL
ncbi:MAG: class I SAM-dependent methyltransferase, partial [Bacteroidota bacterium]|nr:class I SAM-dependent methyltransferase [Bacteroidota bacterium]